MGANDFRDLLDHLRAMLHSDDVPALSNEMIAVSRASSTMALRLLLEDEAFSEHGQYIGIYPGRLSCDGSLRTVVQEPPGGRSHDLHLRLSASPDFDEPSTVPPGIDFVPLNFEPHPRVRVECDVAVADDYFEFHAHVVKPQGVGNRVTKSTETLAVSTIRDAVTLLFEEYVAEPCQHDIDAPFIIP